MVYYVLKQFYTVIFTTQNMPQKNNFYLNDNNGTKTKFFKNLKNNIVRFICDNFHVDTYLFLIIFLKLKKIPSWWI